METKLLIRKIRRELQKDEPKPEVVFARIKRIKNETAKKPIRH